MVSVFFAIYALIILLFCLLLCLVVLTLFMYLILAKLNYLIELVCFLWVISYPENTIVDIFSSLVNTLCYLCHIFFFSHSIRVCLLISFLVMRWSTSFFSFNIISFMHIALQYGILVLNTIKPFFFWVL